MPLDVPEFGQYLSIALSEPKFQVITKEIKSMSKYDTSRSRPTKVVMHSAG